MTTSTQRNLRPHRAVSTHREEESLHFHILCGWRVTKWSTFIFCPGILTATGGCYTILDKPIWKLGRLTFFFVTKQQLLSLLSPPQPTQLSGHWWEDGPQSKSLFRIMQMAQFERPCRAPFADILGTVRFVGGSDEQRSLFFLTIFIVDIEKTTIKTVDPWYPKKTGTLYSYL